MKFRNVVELHNKTSEILREIEKDEYVIITSHGKPKAIIQKFSEEDIEDFVIENSPRIRKSIEEAYKDYIEHGGFSLDQVIKDLEL
ncbi:hypothetical protein ES705_01405 [subsurface metagenome]|nr:type II toxin-antitoxin system prevent-host-death family antitoxin [Clostridia bacterium]TET15566.1 MAG: type II toxin-antitoxin system prevent-host-death family antitoxin [Actinomycetota bacterium]